MNESCVLWVYLTNSGLCLWCKSIGTVTTLHNFHPMYSNICRVYSVCGGFFTLQKICAPCEAGTLGTHVSDLLLDKSLWWWLACLFAFRATVLNFVQVNFAGLYACGTFKLSHFLPRTVRGENAKCHGFKKLYLRKWHDDFVPVSQAYTDLYSNVHWYSSLCFASFLSYGYHRNNTRRNFAVMTLLVPVRKVLFS